MKKFAATLWMIVFCFSLVSAQIAVSGITSTAHTDNVLRYDIDFTLAPAASAYVEYGYWNGNDTIWSSTGVSATNTQHSIAVIGLKATETYAFRVVAFNPSACSSSNPNDFTVAALPTAVGFFGVDSTFTAPGASLGGFLLSSNRMPDPNKVVQVFDRSGELLWYEEMPGDPAPSGDQLCQHVNVTDDQSVFLLECGRILEKSFAGETIADIDVHALNPNWYPHHSAFRNRDGNITALIAIPQTVDKSSVGGSANAIVVAPGIIEVDNQGTLVWSWSAFDHYDPLSSPDPGGYWVPKFGAEAIDWKHASSLLQDLDGNYMVTFRDENHLVKVSRITGNPLWTCGDNGNIDIMMPDTFKRPTSIGLADGANYLMLDLTSQGTVTRAIDWWIDWGYATPTFMIDRSYALPSEFFTAEDGTCARLNGGNTFVASSKGGLFEFDLSGNLLWFGRQDTSLGHAFFVPELYERTALEYTGQILFCIATDTALQLTASPAEGYWYGPGFTAGTFDARVAGAGTHTIFYKYGADTLPVEIMVDADPSCAVSVDPGMAWNLHFNVFPNPFTEHLTLCYTLVRKTDVTVDLFALDGRRIARLFKGNQIPGDQDLRFDMSQYELPEGPVLMRIQTSDGGASTKLLMHY
ncbi:MAG: aryl-sulfate sulfotransferase [Bacteroidota bacterium]